MKSALPSTAYILQIHKNPAQVNTFISQLTATDTADVYVHIDKKITMRYHLKLIDPHALTCWKKAVM